MPQPRPHEEEIFKTAWEIKSPDARTSYLKLACGDDAALHERVVALLRVADEEASFLEQPAAGFVDTVNMPPITEREGSLIGPYKLLQQIGEGGFGVVYMAEQTRPVRRKVALKIIKPGMDTKEVVARFEAERQALALMDHPNIAKVFDAGATESQRPYFVMELVKGVPLTEYCDKNHLSMRERLKLFVDVCHAIQHAHQKGVIHRDLKPSNIMVTLHDGKPVPKVIDFGVSKALSQQLTEKTLFTAYGQMVGTPAYMSPEQAEMSGLDIDTRSDVYSLGVLLYELLTSTTPFDGTRLRSAGYAEMQRIIREEEPPRPSTRLTSLGESSTVISNNRGTDPNKLGQLLRGELDWIVMKALEKDRGRRYETANGVAADVERFLNDEPVVACPPTAAYRFRKFARRYKAQVTVAAGFALLLLASSAVAWWLYADARVARNDAVTARDDLQDERDRAIDAEQTAEKNLQSATREKLRADQNAEELKLRLYDYNLIKAQAAYDHEDIGQTLALLDDCVLEQRHWEWHHLQRLARNEVVQEYELAGAVEVFFLSPDGLRLVIADPAKGTLRLLDATTGQELWARPLGNRILLWAAFSPDGERVAVTHMNTENLFDPTIKSGLEVWETQSGRKIWDTGESGAGTLFCFGEFSPDGRQLSVSGRTSISPPHFFVQLRDAGSGEPIWSTEAPGIASFKFASQGERLYLSIWSGPSTDFRSTLCCWNVQDHSEVWSVDRSLASLIAITPDGTQLVTGGRNHSLQVWDTATGVQIKELHAHHQKVAGSLCFSHNGKWLVSSDNAGYTVLWDWARGQIQRSTRDHMPSSGIVRQTVFSADDRHLVSLDAVPGKKLLFRVLDPSPNVLTLSGHESANWNLAFRPDGRQLVSAGGSDGTVRVWDVATGQELRTISADEFARAVAFSDSHIASGGHEGVKVWDAVTGERLHHWADTGSTFRIEFSPSGDRILAGGDQGLRLWNTIDGELLESWERSQEATYSSVPGFAFSLDGQQVYAVNQSTAELAVWDLAAGWKVISPGDESLFHNVRCLTSSSSNNIVAIGTHQSRRAEIWDVDDEQQVAALQGGSDQDFHCLALDPKGLRLFSGSTAGVVKVWNISSGEELYSIPAHKGEIRSLVLSPDGQTLASSGLDGLVKLWETTRPSPAIAERRRIVREATVAVNRTYQASSAHGDVLASLTADNSLDKQVRQTAIEIAHARGDRPRGPRFDGSTKTPLTRADVRESLDEALRSFADIIQEASHADFDAVNPNSPEECDGGWVWDANYHVIPDFTLDELEYLLDPLVEQYPEAHQFLCLRGFVHGRQGQWEDAKDDFAAALERVPEKTGLWITYAYVLATLHVHQGDFDRYHALSEKALQDCLELDEPRLAELTAKMCLFSRRGITRIDDAVRLARSSMKGIPNSNYRWFSLTAGIAEYRRGNWELAIEVLNEAAGLDDYENTTRAATSNLFQALAYTKLDQRQRAEELLAAAEQIMSSPSYGETEWWNAIIAQAAHEEIQQVFAEALGAAGSSSEPVPDLEASPRAQRIVPSESEWKWLHPVDGIDPAAGDPDFHTTFFTPSYDDTHWQTGRDRPGPAGGFGYGDAAGVEFDVPAQSSRKTAYFRHRFTTDQAYEELLIAMQRDDGVIVYLDGIEVCRSNMSDGADAFDLVAAQDVSGEQETWVGFYRLPGSLEPGEHLLAISLHNRVAQDSDLRIAEITLWGTPRKPAADRIRVDDTR